MGKKEIELILKDLWTRVHRYASSKSRHVPKLRIFVGCGSLSRARKRDPRIFFHVGHRPGVVCVHPDAHKLSVEHLVGLYLHEIGHPLAQRKWGVSEQVDADRAVKEFLGVKLHYKGPLLLEWVPYSVAKRILSVT